MQRTAPATKPLEMELPRGLLAFTAIAVVVAGLLVGYARSLTLVTVVVDEQTRYLRTQQETVERLLMDLGLGLRPEDRVSQPLDAPLRAGMVVRVARARPVVISADDQTATFHTHATELEQILQEARISVGPADELTVEGDLLSPEPTHVRVQRAVPFTLEEDGTLSEHQTTASTVAEALHRLGLTLYLADGVEPPLTTRMRAGLHVTIDRSVPVRVEVDGRALHTRTHRENVGQVLADLDIVLTGQDYTLPPTDAALGDDATIQVIRVAERFEIEQEPIAYETVWQADPDLEIDHQRLLQEGARGIRQRRVRIRYEDGNPVSQSVEDEYVAVPPTTKIMGYGTKIVIRTVNTTSGPVEYWRKIRMLATSYSASTAGTSPSSPWYGYTRTGLKMRKGIVAVDPRMIDLRTRVYVPGYGVGFAGDTGGAIKGHRIDLGYDDHNLELWYRWVDVYLLTPVPDEIDYVLDE